MRLTLLLIGLTIQVARADPAPDAGIDAPTADPDTLTPDELRDVFADNQPAPEPDPDAGEPVTGTLRGGVYTDSDRTTVYRTLAVLAHAWGDWLFNGSLAVDSVTSASVDVRSSPALSAIDVVTSASGRSSTSGGQMTDTRYQGTGGAGWKDGAGHAANLTTAVAKETDYASISGGINGSYDLLDRTVTLIGGFTLTDNWVSSVLDSTLHRKMFAVGWTAGVARVLTKTDALRLRYDGRESDGYLASPYRSVRFGDWIAHLGDQQITFTNTIGPAGGLPERVPGSRISHAAVLEWVHSLAPGVGLHPELRVAHDSWGIDSLTAAIDLRIARPTWRLDAGYRFYTQSRADFFESKYMDAPAMYAFYTSDKELGDQLGHLARLDLAGVLSDAAGPSDTRMLIDLQIDAVHYSYPGFLLLGSRDSVFASLGLSWER